MNEIQIIDYEKRYIKDLQRLSYEWLIKHSLLEPEDEKILNDPEGVVLSQGGDIFFAQSGEEIVGTVSLIPITEEACEVAKLAVTEAYQGKKIGHLLLRHVIAAAKRKGFKKVLLYSNQKLTSALYLYRKYNFVDTPMTHNKYLESDIKMELVL